MSEAPLDLDGLERQAKEALRGRGVGFSASTVLRLIDAARLGEAWQEVEAALPEGWAIDNLRHTAMMDQRWQAEAGSRIGPVVQWNKVRTVIAEGPTPLAALKALATALQERQT